MAGKGFLHELQQKLHSVKQNHDTNSTDGSTFQETDFTTSDNSPMASTATNSTPYESTPSGGSLRNEEKAMARQRYSRNPDASATGGVQNAPDDLSQLEHLNEDSILAAVKDRYSRQKYYVSGIS